MAKEAKKAVELFQGIIESLENIGTESFGAFATLKNSVIQQALLESSYL